MPPVLDHPHELAGEIARLLDFDPVAAAQVKEHLSSERLVELLGLPDRKMEDCELGDVMDQFKTSEIHAWIRSHFTQSEVLKAFRG